MTHSEVFAKLCTTLDHFNDVLNESEKLDDKALKTIQNYFKDSEVTVLTAHDEQKMHQQLEQLEQLRDQVTLTRVKSVDMKQINRRIIRLAQMINKRSEQVKKDAYFVIVKLNVCFIKLLSNEDIIPCKQLRNFYEERTRMKVPWKSSDSALYPLALRTDSQRFLINELMNAVLSDIIEYFQVKNESFVEQFTQDFLNSLEKMIENPDLPVENERSVDVIKILKETAEVCQLSPKFLISQLRYAIIGFGERANRFSMPLLEYITSTASPILMEFTKTINFPTILSSEQINQFEPLFQLYCKNLFAPSQDTLVDDHDNVLSILLDALISPDYFSLA